MRICFLAASNSIHTVRYMEYFIESAKYTDPDIKYIIVGSGNFLPKMEKLIEIFGVGDRVILAGEVTNEELTVYHAAADVFVLPSVSRLEAFGIVGLEAMASGTPTVVSNIPGVSEVIEDGREGLRAFVEKRRPNYQDK